MDSSWTSKLGPEQFKSAVLRAWDVLWTTSNTGIKPSEKFQRLCFLLKGGEGTSAAQPIDEPASIPSNNAIMGMAHTSPMDRGGLLESNHGTDDPKDELISPEKLKRALARIQLINAEVQVHLGNADINYSDAVESEPLTPPTKDMGVDPTPLETTTMCNADTLPEYHAGDNGLRERNLYSSDTKNERISISSSISLSQDSVSNSHFPGTKSLISTTWLLPSLLKDSFEPHSAKGGLQDFIQVDPPVFINWLPGGSAKTRPTGHRRGRPPRTDCEHSWEKVLLSLYDGRRRGRPPRQVLPWSHRPKGHRRGRPPNNYSSLETDPVSTVFFIGFPDASCLLHVLLLLDGDVYPVQTTLHFFSKGEEVSSMLKFSCSMLVSGIQFCPFLTILM